MKFAQRCIAVIIIVSLLGANLFSFSRAFAQDSKHAFMSKTLPTASFQPVIQKSGVLQPNPSLYMVFLPHISTGPAPVTTVTIPASGGSASFADGKITLSFPAGSANGAITLKVTTQQAQPPNTMTAYGPAIDVQAFDAAGNLLTIFNKDVTITFFYDQLSFLIWPTMRIYTKSNGGDWSYVPSTETVPGQKAVKATVSHFSSYAMFGAARAITTTAWPAMKVEMFTC